MSWPNPWTGPTLPQGIRDNPANVMGMGMTPDQWSTMQQNWQQWNQWQQQYSQWQTQFGDQYAKQMQSMAPPTMIPQPPLPSEAPPLPSQAPSLPPPPPDQPPPHENDQPLYGVPPPMIPTIQPNIQPQWNQWNAPNNPNMQNWNAVSVPKCVPQPEIKAIEDIVSEEERQFDLQFQKWEEEFEKWKKQNANHPDKQAYREYEKKFEVCRVQLLERRKQMQQKRLNKIVTVKEPNNQHSIGLNQTSEVQYAQIGQPPMKEPVNPNLIVQPDFFSASVKTNSIPGLDLVADSKNNKRGSVDTTDGAPPRKKPSRFDDPSANVLFTQQNPLTGNVQQNPPVHVPQNQMVQNQNYFNKTQQNFQPNPNMFGQAHNNFNQNQQNNLQQNQQTFGQNQNFPPKSQSLASFSNQPQSGFNNKVGQFQKNFNNGINQFQSNQGNIGNLVQYPNNYVNNQNQNSANNWYESQANFNNQNQKPVNIPHSNINLNPTTNQNTNVNKNTLPSLMSLNVNQPKPIVPEITNNDDFRGPNVNNKIAQNQDDKPMNQYYGDAPQVINQQQTTQKNMNTIIQNQSNYEKNLNQGFLNNNNTSNEYNTGQEQVHRQSIVDKWANEPVLEPDVIVDYNHTPLRSAEKDFIEPVQTFDYNHIPKEGEKKEETKPDVWSELDMFSRRFGTKVIDYQNKSLNNDTSSKLIEEWNPSKNLDTFRQRKDPEDNRYSSYERRDSRDAMAYSRDMRDLRDSRDIRDMRDSRTYRDSRDLRENRDSRDLRYSRDYNNYDRYDERRNSRDRSREREYDRRYRDERVRDSRRNRSESNEPEVKVIEKPVVKQNATVVMIDDLLELPGREIRPEKIVILIRGPPGSGKSYISKIIKDREVENGGQPPKILSIDNYFIQEEQIQKTDPKTGQKTTQLVLKYVYDEPQETVYMNSLLRSFKRNITSGYYPFMIVEAVFDQLKSYAEFWNFSKQNGYQVYICTMDLDVQTCHKRNIHERKFEDIAVIVSRWFPTPSNHITLDVTTLLQNAAITEVEMEDIKSDDDVIIMEDEADEDQLEMNLFSSKWDTDDTDKLARLDGISKPLRPSQFTMEEYLQIDDWEPPISSKPGKKRVRWADIEEKRKQEMMRAIGFVVGQTDWNRMTDPTQGSSALTQTKYIERVRRN